ncbi:hypothetical protein HGRIS_011429 [Hohenbuehelia grisea]|uniref:Fungal N-terminal domain-containing protein n=1 Tax=Hohenbuehelia grisea TaxID=104357 RepID=A0ABR3JWT2_9AGAR
MDPLSVSVSVLALVEAAQKIKELVDKVGHNRARLRQLAGDVVHDIADIQEFCQVHYELQNTIGAQDLREGLENVARELSYVLHRCEKFSQHGTKMRGKLMAWINRNDIEADIVRLKDRVQACHTRFLSFSSARTEQNVLLLLYEHRCRTQQLGQLVPSMLLENKTNGVGVPEAIEDALPGDIMYTYLRQQLRNINAAIDTVFCTRYDWYEEPDQTIEILQYNDVLSPSTCASASTRFRVAFFYALTTLDHLGRRPENISMQRIAYILRKLGEALRKLNLLFEAGSMTSTSARIFEALINANETEAYLWRLATTLDRLTVQAIDNQDARVASEGAVAVWSQLYGYPQGSRYSQRVAEAFSAYAVVLAHDHQFEKALDYSRRGLELIRQAPETNGVVVTVTWVGFGGDHALACTSPRKLMREVNEADSEAYSLRRVARNSAALGCYGDAWMAGWESMNCYQALLDAFPWSCQQPFWTCMLRRFQSELPTWVPLNRQPLSLITLPHRTVANRDAHPNHVREVVISQSHWGFPSSLYN